MAMSHRTFFLLLACAVVLAAVPASAQLGTAFDTDLTLEFSPAQPLPGGTVHITATSLLIDLSGKTLIWFKDGKQFAEGEGLTAVDVVAGPLGSEDDIVVGVYEGDLELVSQSARIHPVEIDLIWEADSYVPPQFRGRALPSAGTHLRLEAIPYFVRANGSSVPPSDITFTWRRDGYVIQSASGRGRSQAVIDSPKLFDTDTISVDARTSDGLFEGTASVRVPAAIF